MQLTHSLKPPGFNPRAYEVKNWFQNLLLFFKRNLYSYNSVRQVIALKKKVCDGTEKGFVVITQKVGLHTS
jgi:hypothetical protein